MCLRLSALLIVVVGVLGLAAAQESDRIEVVLPRDAIPAIDAPEIRSG